MNNNNQVIYKPKEANVLLLSMGNATVSISLNRNQKWSVSSGHGNIIVLSRENIKLSLEERIANHYFQRVEQA